ncbi:MAG: ABC transporter ATP-binding protein [Bacilli bacterium]|nr:ABC transporter ATP-binding protein [Bacilli bacterium]
MKKLRIIRPYLKGSISLIILSLVCAFIAIGSKLAIPLLAGKVINQFVSSEEVIDVEVAMILMFSLVAIGTIFRYLFDYLTGYIGAKTVKKIRDDVFSSYMHGLVKDIKSEENGDLVLRLVNDVENVQTGLVSGFAAFYDGIVTILMTIVFMFVLNWVLALIVIILTPISIVVSRFISKFNSKHFKSQAKDAGTINGFVNETLVNSETITIYDLKESKNKEFNELNEKYHADNFKANMGASIINPSTRLVNAFINAIVIIVGALIIIQDWKLGIVFLVGDLSSFLTYSANFMQPFNEISDVLAEINYAFASLSRISEAINIEKEDVDSGNLVPETIDTIKANNISFSYVPGKKIISNYSFVASRGKKIALVGPTGCGKTTVLSILMRFYELDDGKIEINNEDLATISKKDYREIIGMVLQEPWIFSGTVYENIAYAKKDASKEEVIEAAKKAQAYGFIQRLPQGIDTYISDSSGLSLGEKQLISVTRIILLSPEIVILDEATSNIDIRTEFLLAKSFDELMKGKTSFVVAHRLSTIVNSDLILVMKDGEIVESGTHKELLEKKGFYHKMYSSQFN